MQPNDAQRQLLPIGVVVEMLQRDYPEVSHSSLRFLEREGLIVPTRTPGGHRLFTDDDIERIRQIKEWQARRLSLEEIRHRLQTLESVGPPDTLAERFLSSALAGDLGTARQTIVEATELGMPLSVVFSDVLRPALVELGSRWERGTITVAQEKEVSEFARELIAELTLRHSLVVEGHRNGVVAACVMGELHELGLRMLIGLLRARRVSVHYLGASVDPAFLVDSARMRRPRVVLLSATLDENLPAVRIAHDAVRDAGISTRILAGGQAVARHHDTVAGWGIEIADEDPDTLVGTIVAACAG
jgi:MerR family transcriptional regulator, light-induced transcriptional regulator